MVTAGLDSKFKVWDIRKYQPVFEYNAPYPATSLSISQKGLLSVGFGPNVEIWKHWYSVKQDAPYMTHLIPTSRVQDLQFCPFEDVLGIGHAKGFTSILVPGSGEPNFDALEANPFETKKQRKEKEVKSLLEKVTKRIQFPFH